MISKGLLGRLVFLLLVATAMEPLLADEPVVPPPPATSIREWKSAPTDAPSAGAQAGPQAPARSVREWKSTSVAAPTGNCLTTTIVTPAAAPVANAMAKPDAGAAVQKIPVTISITSSLREGNLVVMLDDVPIFNESFQKPALLFYRTTTWDPLEVAAGDHRLSATVFGSKKKYFSKLYDLHLGRTGGSKLRFVMQGDKLTVDLAS